MKDYLMFNKMKLTYNLIKLRICEFFHPDMSFTINYNTYENNKNNQLWFPSHVEDSTLLTHNINDPIKKTIVIPIGNINKAKVDIGQLISDYKDEIEFDETDGEIFFITNKKEELN